MTGMSAFGPDIPVLPFNVRFRGVKRTSRRIIAMSAFDPNQTCVALNSGLQFPVV
jgi:hypothetical protein